MNKAVFLRAHWRDLLMVTWALPPEQLQPHLPPGTEPDLWNGQALVSLVAFDFSNTRVRGIKVPGHVNFPEINLRYYCRLGDERGVGFIREYVNRPCISLLANRLYNEHYATRWLRYSRRRRHGSQEHHYSIIAGGRPHTFRIWPEQEAHLPAETTLTHFLKERPRGFGTAHTGELLRYRVEHPFWYVQPIRELELNVDYGRLFGFEWAFLNEQAPLNTLFAAGSEVSVRTAEKLAYHETSAPVSP